MSEGPISRWWRSHEPVKVSTPNASRVCGAKTISTSVCGRKPHRGAFTTNWDDVTCADCHAARRADAEGARAK